MLRERFLDSSTLATGGLRLSTAHARFTQQRPWTSHLVRLFAAPNIGPVMWNTLVWTVGSVVGGVVVGYLGALVLQSKHIKLVGLWRGLVMIPWIIPGVVAATVWRWTLSTDYGILNRTLLDLGLIDAPGSAMLHAAIHRIVQECLTNVLRYAHGASTIDVSIGCSASAGTVTITVVDDGAPTGSQSLGTARGLIGISERAASFGGGCTYGPRSPRGWAVTTTLRTEKPR